MIMVIGDKEKDTGVEEDGLQCEQDKVEAVDHSSVLPESSPSSSPSPSKSTTSS